MKPSWVPKTWRSIPATSSMIWMKSGSRWPNIGAVMALRTLGLMLEGPAPRSRRGGGFNSETRWGTTTTSRMQGG